MQPASSLHSALFNYTPLEIGGTDKYKQLIIVILLSQLKLALTAINKMFAL
jgi:hypothetical protein